MKQSDVSQFTKTLSEELKLAWLHLKLEHPNDHFYSFGIVTMMYVEYIGIASATEEGLEAVSKEYAESSGKSIQLHKTALRWSFGDSPLIENGMQLLPKTTDLRKQYLDPYEGSEESQVAVDYMFEAMIDALKLIDSANVFGNDRSNLVLNIWMGDQSDEERLHFAKLLNNKETYSRFKKEYEIGMKTAMKMNNC